MSSQASEILEDYPNPEERCALIENFNAYLASMEERIGAYVEVARRRGFVIRLDSPGIGPFEQYLASRRRFRDDVIFVADSARFLGEWFRRNKGGAWYLDLDDPQSATLGQPVIDYSGHGSYLRFFAPLYYVDLVFEGMEKKDLGSMIEAW